MKTSPHKRTEEITSERLVWASSLLAAALLCVCMLAGSASNIDTTGSSKSATSLRRLYGDKWLKSHGHSIRTEWFAAAGSTEATRLVLILPGSGGIEPDGGFYRQLASLLAKDGATAVVVHYMDRNGLQEADSAQMSAHFSEWMQTINETVTFVHAQPGCAKAPISLLGHSLGAQLALHEAASDERVDSIIDMAGCFVLSTKNIKREPRVLILHCTGDNVVSIGRERQMIAVLKRTNSKYEEHIFQRGDHVFSTVYIETLVNLIAKFLGLGLR